MPERRRFKAGEVIIRENDPGETAFVIENGLVEVTKQSDGKRVHLASLGFPADGRRPGGRGGSPEPIFFEGP